MQAKSRPVLLTMITLNFFGSNIVCKNCDHDYTREIEWGSSHVDRHVLASCLRSL